MFFAALRSRSWLVPQCWQVQARTCSGFLPSTRPQAEHVCDDGYQRSILCTTRSYRWALYSSIATNWPHPASCTLLASRVRPSPDTARFSTYTAWFSRMICVESLCVQFRRLSATLACALASLSLAFSRFFDPFCLRDSARCAFFRRRSAWRRYFGAATLCPSDRTAKCVRPKSMPTSAADSGNGSTETSTTKLAKYRPAASLITVTEDGADGSWRDQRILISPILATYRRPFGRIENPLRVNRIDCRLSLRDLNFGGPTGDPLRLPVTEEKNARYALCRSFNACTSASLGASASHTRSGLAFFASVITRRWRSVSLI